MKAKHFIHITEWLTADLDILLQWTPIPQTLCLSVLCSVRTFFGYFLCASAICFEKVPNGTIARMYVCVCPPVWHSTRGPLRLELWNWWAEYSSRVTCHTTFHIDSTGFEKLWIIKGGKEFAGILHPLIFHLTLVGLLKTKLFRRFRAVSSFER